MSQATKKLLEFQPPIPIRTFRFLDLLLELREIVYSYLVEPLFPTELEAGQISTWFNPSILLTSRRLYHEAKPVIYNRPVSISFTPSEKTYRFKNSLEGCPFKRCEVKVDVTLAEDIDGKIMALYDRLIFEINGMTCVEKVGFWTSRPQKQANHGFQNLCLNNDLDVGLYLWYPMFCLRDLADNVSVTFEGDISMVQAHKTTSLLNNWRVHSGIQSSLPRATKLKLYVSEESDAIDRARIRPQIVDLRWRRESDDKTGVLMSVLTDDTLNALKVYPGCERIAEWDLARIEGMEP